MIMIMITNGNRFFGLIDDSPTTGHDYSPFDQILSVRDIVHDIYRTVAFGVRIRLVVRINFFLNRNKLKMM